MDQHHPKSPPSAGLPATVSSTALGARNNGALDEQHHAPDDYDWVPVRRKPRNDGWSHERQRGFIEVLADCGSVIDAARQVGMSASTAYRLRRSPGGEAFAHAWDAAIHQAALHLVDVAFDRAIKGSDEPVFDREGRRVGRRMRQNDRLLMFLLRAHLPERYAHAHRAELPAAAAMPLLAPVAQAIAALAPPVPAEPEQLMPPELLAHALDLADLYDGAPPPGLRDRDGPADDGDPDPTPLGVDFEVALAVAKDAAGAPMDLPDDYYEDDDFEDEGDVDPDDENPLLA